MALYSTEIKATENNTKSMNTIVRRGVLLSFQRVKTKFFSVKDSRIVTLKLDVLYNFQYIPLNDPIILVPNSCLMTSKKGKYGTAMCFFLCVSVIIVSAALPSY